MPPQGTTGSIQGAKLSDPNGDRAERTRLEVEFAAHLGGAGRHDQPASPVGALTELRPALEEALQTVTGLLGAERGIIALYEATTDELVTAASLGIPPSSPAKLDRMPSPALESTAGETLGDDDVIDDPRWAELVGTDASGTIRRVPLATSRGELMGMIVVSVPPAVRPSEQEAEIVRAYARQSAEVIERGRLSLQA
ncbi:MAG: GAF domain-containing protein, partial [Actinobacteria bacterium]|nr:GAF domain-containing protein [Actinomycetota bacterium]